MKKQKDNRFFNLISLLTIFIGVFLRVYHLFTVGFSVPWRFGGLFLEFARQIYENSYSLPITIPHYTLGGLPFAYPPIPFYIEAFLVFSVGLPEFLVVNLLPPIFSIISLLLFYLFLKKIFTNKFAQLTCLTFFSLYKICFVEQVEAAGLAESLGTIFIILLLFVFWRFYKQPKNITRIFLASVVWALTVMVSPGSAYFSIFIFLVLVILLIRIKGLSFPIKIRNIFILGFVAVALSSLYWGNVIINHGIDLFTSSFSMQHNPGLIIKDSIFSLVNLNMLDIGGLINLLFFISLLVLIYKGKYEISVLGVISMMIPRETWIRPIIGILIIGYAIELIFNHSINEFLIEKSKTTSMKVIGIIIIFMVYYPPLNFVNTRDLIDENSLDLAQVEFLEEVRHSFSDVKNIIILGNDEFIEWSPYITEMTVLNVTYGTEFAPEKFWIREFNYYAFECNDILCVDQLIKEYFQLNDIAVILDMEFMNNIDLMEIEDQMLGTKIHIDDGRFVSYILPSGFE